jgi:aquaporin related protein
MLGAILASGFYKFIKVLEYETVNPGQDDTNPTHLPTVEAVVLPELNGESTHGTIGALSSGAHARPLSVQRLTSQRIRTDSPGMGTNDDAYQGLATGMHGEERRGSKRVEEEKATNGIV